MSAIIYNGNIIEGNDMVISYKNRSFRYGDGLFESIRVINGEVFNFNAHFLRLKEAMKMFYMDLPEMFSEERIKEQIQKLLVANQVKEGAKVRLTIFREGENSSYRSNSNKSGYLLECEALSSNYFKLNNDGVDIDLFNDMPKPVNKYSIYKTCNAFYYTLASLEAARRGLDDYMLLNKNDYIIEATSSNIFLVSNGVLYTPPISDGCVAGTMRMKVINLAIDNGIKVYETSLTPQYLLTSDEVFLTNAIQGVQWVKSYREKRYFHNVSQKIINLLNASIQ